MNNIACAHPGKMGDALYSLQVARCLSETTGKNVDFYTSKYCAPLKDLFLYQSFIDNFYMPDSYVIENMGCGVQPYSLPIDITKYRKVYQLGFKNTPNTDLPTFIAKSVGTSWDGKVIYDYPDKKYFDSDYIVVAPRGMTGFIDFFSSVERCSPIPVLIIGGPGDYVGFGRDFTGLNFLDTVALISKARAFFGLMSSQLVLANGFDLPKIVPHDGKSWDMRHVIRGNNNYYLVNPTVNHVTIKGVFDALL